MGYLGTGPLGLKQGGLTEPIQLQTKEKDDKIGLGYGHNTPSTQRSHTLQQNTWRKKVSPKENMW